jgi:hypothetical protein
MDFLKTVPIFDYQLYFQDPVSVCVERRRGEELYSIVSLLYGTIFIHYASVQQLWQPGHS